MTPLAQSLAALEMQRNEALARAEADYDRACARIHTHFAIEKALLEGDERKEDQRSRLVTVTPNDDDYSHLVINTPETANRLTRFLDRFIRRGAR